MIAPGQQCGARRRAQRGGVEVGVAQSAGGHRIDVRGRDLGAVAAQIGKPHVVKDDVDHIGRTRRRAGRLGPIRRRLVGGVADRRLTGLFVHAKSWGGQVVKWS